jgi:hypothetical protein
MIEPGADVYVIGATGLVEEITQAGFTAHGLEDSGSLPGGFWTGELTANDLLPRYTCLCASCQKC